MRLGILAFGEPLAEIQAVGDTLRARDFDVIVASGEPTPIREEAKRLQRADCDGVLFTLGEGAQADDIAEAALYTTCPILLIAPSSNTVQSKGWNILHEVAVAFDALFTYEASAERISEWLQENGKTERQRGIEAAYKLYGVRLIVGSEVTADLRLRREWIRRFGILLSSETNPDKTRPDDLQAPDGDMAGVLTERLLRLVSGSEDIQAVQAERFVVDETDFSSDIVTVAQIEFVPASSYRFSSRVFPAEMRELGIYRIGGETQGFLRDDSAGAYPPRFFAAKGDHIGAWRAACDTLDIAVKYFRREP